MPTPSSSTRVAPPVQAPETAPAAAPAVENSPFGAAAVEVYNGENTDTAAVRPDTTDANLIDDPYQEWK